MEQIKEKITMVRPVEWEATHLDAHNHINSAITHFYKLFDDIVQEINTLTNMNKDTEQKNFVSFSGIREDIKWLREEIKNITAKIDEINVKLNEWGKFLTKRYEWIIDTDKETVVELDPITDKELMWKQYLANIVVNEASPNQWAIAYTFPETSIVHWEYKPRLYLMAKDGEHAVLEYDFTVILTEI